MFTRSAYLQSLVLMDPQTLPEKMAFVKPTLEKHQTLCKAYADALRRVLDPRIW